MESSSRSRASSGEGSKGVASSNGGNIVNQRSETSQVYGKNGSDYPSSNQMLVQREVEFGENSEECGVNDLLDSASKVNSCAKNSFKIMIKIGTLDELNKFIKLLLEKPDAKFIKNIKGLDFGSIRFESTSTTGPITINLPESLNGLIKLCVGHIGWKVVVNLPESLDNLVELSIGNIRNIITIPKELPCLRKLSIGAISVSFDLPERLDSLESLAIDAILVDFSIPQELDNLKSLIINGFSCKFSLPTSFKSLEILTLGGNYGDDYFQLPYSIPTLLSLSAKVYGRSKLTLPIILDNLKTLNLEIRGAQIILPNSLDRLSKLTINNQEAVLRDNQFLIETDSEEDRLLLEEINKCLGNVNKRTTRRICCCQ